MAQSNDIFNNLLLEKMAKEDDKNSDNVVKFKAY